MSKIDRMFTFAKVVELESFRAAAKSLGISPAAVSKQIALLEKELQVELIERTTRKLTLTPQGSKLYESLGRIIKEIDEVQEELTFEQKEPKGQLLVVSSPYFANLFILPHLDEFYERYKKVVLDLALEERIPDLEKEKIDLLIGMSISAQQDSIQRKIATTRYLFAAAPKYLKKYGMPKKPEDLKKHHYITHSMRRPNTTLSFAHNKEVTVAPALFINDSQAMVKAAINGLGIIKAHEYAVREAIQEKKLIEVLPGLCPETVPIWIAYRKRTFLPSKIRVFIDFVQEKIKER